MQEEANAKAVLFFKKSLRSTGEITFSLNEKTVTPSSGAGSRLVLLLHITFCQYRIYFYEPAELSENRANAKISRPVFSGRRRYNLLLPCWCNNRPVFLPTLVVEALV